MKTAKLIDALVADAPLRGMSVSRAFAIATAAGVLTAAALFAAWLGVRPDAGDALATWRFVLKLAICAALALTAFKVAYDLSIPGRDPRLGWSALWAAPVMLGIGVAGELLFVPSEAWAVRAVGDNSWVCLQAIPGFGVLILAAAFFALRHAAPTRPELAGAAAGLAAGGAAALLYGLHCPDDSPFFIALWYVAGVAVVTALGALAGRLFVRW